MMASENNDDENGIFINLTVPPGVEAGVDSLTFECGGSQMEVLVPLGSVPGDVIRLQVGDVEQDENTTKPSSGASDNANLKAASSAAVAENDSKDTKSLSSSSLMKELGGLKSDTTFAVDDNCKGVEDMNARNTDGIISVKILDSDIEPIYLQLLEKLPDTDDGNSEGNDKGDGTAGHAWPCGILLAQTLTSIEWDVKPNHYPINCLELGSGLGACGLTLARDLSSFANKVNIILTDQGEKTIELLKRNIDRNFHLIKRQNGVGRFGDNITLKAEELVWGNTLKAKGDKFQIILGSDLLYNTQGSYAPLIKTIKHHLHLEEGMVILAVRWRKPDLERRFFEKAEQDGLHFELWQGFNKYPQFQIRSPCALTWEQYGNPKYEASNRFFQTMVSVGNKQCSLANVSELMMEGMSDEEYATFEEIQCQIYIGKYCEKKKEAPKKRKHDDN